MTKSFLIATVATFALVAPAQAEVPRERAEARQQKQAKQERGDRQSLRSQVRERAGERQQRRAEIRQERRAPRFEARQERRVEARQDRRAQPFEARQRIERRAEQRQRFERVRPERIERRIQRADRPRLERSERRLAERLRDERVEQRRLQRIERRRIERPQRRDNRGLERSAFVIDRNRERFAAKREQQLQKKLMQQAERAERREFREERKALARAFARPDRMLGERIDLKRRLASRDWYDDYAARRYAAADRRYVYDYDYDDGYLYKVDPRTSAVAGLIPLLGGAFSVARPLPAGYGDYNVPYAYRSLYYDTPMYNYRYGSGAIYQVDPKTQLVQSVVALLTGQNLGIGQMMPAGYDVYNVPYAYRDRFVDDDDMWYRYADGYIYGLDPYSRRIQSVVPLNYGAYSVGYQVPAYAGYGGYGGYPAYAGYAAPYGYQNVYYSQPGYNYQYANGGIYQVDPATQIVKALVALVTGANLGVGQLLPSGYDVYNVPAAYRGTYFDTDDSWYRYDDGYIYQVDPASRLIQASIPVNYGGYMVGQPVPAGFPGYAVPSQYDGLYHQQPGYDYRYFDGGIYALDPSSQLVQSQVALLTGNSFGVGQPLPMGYDVYNVPFAYRDRYYDTPTTMYRYADGYIYQVDPTTRLIQAVIDAIV